MMTTTTTTMMRRRRRRRPKLEPRAPRPALLRKPRRPRRGLARQRMTVTSFSRAEGAHTPQAPLAPSEREKKKEEDRERESVRCFSLFFSLFPSLALLSHFPLFGRELSCGLRLSESVSPCLSSLLLRLPALAEKRVSSFPPLVVRVPALRERETASEEKKRKERKKKLSINRRWPLRPRRLCPTRPPSSSTSPSPLTSPCSTPPSTPSTAPGATMR